MPGYIYLLKMAPGDIYKIGRTYQDFGLRLRRFSGYPKDSEIVFVRKCISDVNDCERKIIDAFCIEFGPPQHGYEYFAGSERTMIDLINAIMDDSKAVPKARSVPTNAPSSLKNVSCPKCKQEFTDLKFLSRAQAKLERHLARKNACDSQEPYKFERKIEYVPPNIGSLDLTGLVESLNDNVRFRHVTSHIFNELNDRNKFVVWPNVANNEVFYMDNDESVRTTPTGFVPIFWKRVIQDQVVPLLREKWSMFKNYSAWIRDHNDSSRDFLTTDMSFTNSAIFRDLRTSISSHLKDVPRSLRCEIRFNMLH